MEILKTRKLGPLECLSLQFCGVIFDDMDDTVTVFSIDTDDGLFVIFCTIKEENKQTVLSPYKIIRGDLKKIAPFSENLIIEHIKNYTKLAEVIE